jgi:hypothetical protein
LRLWLRHHSFYTSSEEPPLSNFNSQRDIPNEYANSLNKDQLKGLVVEITGLNAKDRVVDLICQTFDALKKLANFEAAQVDDTDTSDNAAEPDKVPPPTGPRAGDLGLNLAYTINLVLPKSEDPAVFNAIFKALREHLLRK